MAQYPAPPSGYGGSSEVASHSSKITNDRVNELLKQIDYYCTCSFIEPSRDNLIAWFSLLRALHNSTKDLLKDPFYEKLLVIMPRVWENIQRITDVRELNQSSYFLKEKQGRLMDSRMLRSQCLNDLDFIHNTLISALQEQNYFFRVDDMPVKGVKNRLRLLLEREGVTGQLSFTDEEKKTIVSKDDREDS